MKKQLSKIEKEYLDARVDDLFKTFKFQTVDEVGPTFDYITDCFYRYWDACDRKVDVLKR